MFYQTVIKEVKSEGSRGVDVDKTPTFLGFNVTYESCRNLVSTLAESATKCKSTQQCPTLDLCKVNQVLGIYNCIHNYKCW